MKLLPLEARGVFDVVAGWLARKENYQWLAFGNGFFDSVLNRRTW